MTELSRVKSTIEALEGKSAPSLEDALGVFLDLSEDMKEAGAPINDLKVGNADEMIKKLRRNGRLLMKIIESNRSSIEEGDTGGRTQRLESELDAELKIIEQKERELLQEEARLQEKKNELQQKKEKLEQEQAGIELKRRMCAELEAEAESLRQYNEKYKNISIPFYQEQIRNLNEEQTKLEGQIQKCQNEQALKEKEKRKAETRLTQAESDRDKALQELNGICSKEQKAREETEALVKDKQEKEMLVAELGNQYKQLSDETIAIQQEIDRLLDHIRYDDMDCLKKERDRLGGDKLVFDAQMSGLNKECSELKETITKRKKQLEELEKKKTQAQELVRKIEEQMKSARETTERSQRQKDELERQWNADRELYEGLRNAEIQETLDRIGKKYSLFRQAQKELFAETEGVDATFYVTKSNIEDKRNEMQNQLSTITLEFEKVRKTYKIVCKILEQS